MEDKIIKIEEETGMMSLNLIDGSKMPVKSKTIYTYWQSGRQDCAVEIERPLEMSGLQNKI